MRRRFIRSALLSNPDNWSDVYEDIKTQVLETSAFQLVGNKGIVEVNSKSGETYVLVEVVGVPRFGIQTEDHEARTVLTFEHPDSAYKVDFLTLKQDAEAIIGGMQQRLDPCYHIVFDSHHLALHFFI